MSRARSWGPLAFLAAGLLHGSLNPVLAAPAGADAAPAPTPELALSFVLTKTLPAGRTLSPAEAERLLGVEDFPAAQRRAVRDQVWIYATPEVAVVLPRSVRAGAFEGGLPLQIFNRTDGTLQVRWDDSLFLDGRGNDKLCYLGPKVKHPTGDRPNRLNTSLVPTPIPPGLFLKTHVFPIGDFDFERGSATYQPQPGQLAVYLVLEGPQGKVQGYSLQGNLRLAAGALRPSETPAPELIP